jgi:hypothetical protein
MITWGREYSFNEMQKYLEAFDNYIKTGLFELNGFEYSSFVFRNYKTLKFVNNITAKNYKDKHDKFSFYNLFSFKWIR